MKRMSDYGMSEHKPWEASYTESDLEFVVDAAAPGAANKARLKELVRKDDGFRKALVHDERVFQRVMNDEEIFLKISPALYFEVLLWRALAELEKATHTVERAGRQSIPVFDTKEVVDLLSRTEVLYYLANMLASFTRIYSYAMSVRVRPGVRRRIRYNDMDIDSLMRFATAADEEQRLGLYKRIADVCLFITGIFPDHAFFDRRYPASGEPRPRVAGRLRRGLEDYEREGRVFYGMAEEHPAARALKLSEVFGLLRLHFTSARKPLSYIATHYLHTRKRSLFGLQPE